MNYSVSKPLLIYAIVKMFKTILELDMTTHLRDVRHGAALSFLFCGNCGGSCGKVCFAITSV